MRTSVEVGSSGWFGEIPDSWEMKPLKSLFCFSKGLSITKADLVEQGAPVVSYGQIHSKLNECVALNPNLMRYVSVDTSLAAPKACCQKDGFIFADTSEDVEGCGNCVRMSSEISLQGGYHTIVLNPRISGNTKYFAYLFLTDAWRSQIRRDLVDVKLFSVNQEKLKETYVVVPPEKVQQCIVAFLDERCAAIDEDIAKRREVIEKLGEYKAAVITEAVMKGLNSNVEMKDSGVEWVKRIPSNWEVLPLKAIYSFSKGLSITKSDLVDKGCDVISYGQIHAKWNTGTTIREDLIRFVPREIASGHPSSLGTKGSFIFADTSEDIAGCGNAAYIDEDRDIYGGYHTIVASPKTKVFGKYFAYQFLTSAWRSQLIEQFVDVKLFSITQGSLKCVSVLVPDYAEQRSIALYLDERCAAIDRTISCQSQIIEKLEEYRKSLIHHAVTGKIDCREV